MFQQVIDDVDVGMGLLINLVLDVETGRGNYPTPTLNLMTSGPVLLPTSHVEVRAGHFFATHVAMWQMKGGVIFLFLGFLEWSNSLHFPVNRVSSIVPPRRGAGPAFLSVGACKEESQLPHQLEAIGVTEGGHLSLAPTIIPQMKKVVRAMPLSHPRGWLTSILSKGSTSLRCQMRPRIPSSECCSW